MRGRYTRINKRQIKTCNKCQAEIFFVQNRNGKWFPVDVLYPGEGEHRYPAYKHSAGAYNNMIPWHTCRPLRDYVGERLVKQAQSLGLCIATRALQEFLANPDTDQSRLVNLTIRNNTRIERRLQALPETSRAWVR